MVGEEDGTEDEGGTRGGGRRSGASLASSCPRSAGVDGNECGVTDPSVVLAPTPAHGRNGVASAAAFCRRGVVVVDGPSSAGPGDASGWCAARRVWVGAGDG